MKREEVERFELVIISSIPVDEKQTGEELHSSLITYKKFTEENLHSSYHDISNKDELFNLLSELVKNSMEKNHFYILHFEVHGFSGGIQLKDGELVSWEELIPEFRKMNVHYADMLLIVLAVCKGASILQFVDPSERSPFRGLVSSAKDLSEPDIINGFEVFYDHYFFTFDIVGGVEKFNSVKTNQEGNLSVITSETCFDRICDLDRPSADIPSLIESVREQFDIKHPDKSKWPQKRKDKLIEVELRAITEDVKKNKGFFLMKDLK